MKGKVAAIVENELTEIISSLGYELYEVEYQKKQNGMNLTIFIVSKNEQPINIKDCELVHRTIDPILDEINPTNDEPYYLNVSSVGLDRPLKTDKDFKRSLNQEIELKLFSMVEGNKSLEGVLNSFDENIITIQSNNSQIQINRNNIALCKLKIKI